VSITPCLLLLRSYGRLRLSSRFKASLGSGPRFRGGGGGDPVDEPAFRVGVQAVNLQVGLQAGNGDSAKDSVALILQALEGQIGVGELEKSYAEKITRAVEGGKPPRELAGVASTLSADSRELGPKDFDLGQWVEAGRLAAIAQEPSYFQSGDTRAFLRRLLWRQKFGLGGMNLDPVALQSLRDISEVLETKDLESSDYARLRRNFEAILNVYYPQS
jgi:hypothetical protein